MKQLKKTMTAAVIATVVACGGLYASAANAVVYCYDSKKNIRGSVTSSYTLTSSVSTTSPAVRTMNVSTQGNAHPGYQIMWYITFKPTGLTYASPWVSGYRAMQPAPGKNATSYGVICYVNR